MPPAHAAHSPRTARQGIGQIQARSDQVLCASRRDFEFPFRGPGKGQDGPGAITHLKAHAGYDADDGVQNGISCIKVLDALEGGDAVLADQLQAVYQILAVLAEQPLRLGEGFVSVAHADREAHCRHDRNERWH